MNEDVVGEKDSDCTELKSLEEVKDVMEHQQVSITGKVTLLLEIEELMKKSNKKVLRKHDFVIADSSGSCRGVVWEENMVELKENSSYKILILMVLSICQLVSGQ